MRFLHTMLRVRDLDASLAFFGALGLQEVRRRKSEGGRFTLVFLSTGHAEDPATVELTHNWEPEPEWEDSRYFGHLAYAVEDIYATCQRLQDAGVTILRPPRDGRMAFVRSPDQQSVELLQEGDALAPAEPWASMQSTGRW